MDNDKLAASIRSLTIAVWCLRVVFGLQLLVVGWTTLRAFMWRSANVQPVSRAASKAPQDEQAAAEEFQALPLEQKIAKASAIAITRYKRDGNSLRPIITEIPKVRAGTKIHYQVGQELEVDSHQIEPGTDFGDGDVVFFTGNPAEMSQSFSYSHDRIGYGDMPLGRLRELAKAAK